MAGKKDRRRVNSQGKGFKRFIGLFVGGACIVAIAIAMKSLETPSQAEANPLRGTDSAAANTLRTTDPPETARPVRTTASAPEKKGGSRLTLRTGDAEPAPETTPSEPAHQPEPRRLAPVSGSAKPLENDPPRRFSPKAGPIRKPRKPVGVQFEKEGSRRVALPEERIFKSDEKPIVAVVNNQPITREQLARECLIHYGTSVLERIVNKWLIAQACMEADIAISDREIDAEVERVASRFGLPVDRWLTMLKQERGISPEQYSDDIIWPTLALRKLAGERLQVTMEELQRAYETQFGPAVRARLISVLDPVKARKLQEEAAADPDRFGDLAKEHSQDANSAAANGLIQPIRMHGSYKELEDAAFSMKDGEVSKVIHVAGQYLILKREGLIEARDIPFESVAPKLEEMIRQSKLRKVAAEVFQELQQGTTVKNVFNDPKAQAQMPGVAAIVGKHQITLRELAEACIERHGEETLDGTINRTLLEQACKRRNITVTEEELDDEIVRAASLALPPKADGSPDVEGWIKQVTEGQNISAEVYRRDSVWPSVALRKLVGDSVSVTEEDIRRGYEANYGPRVRCRAIVMSDPRRATRVWDMARNDPTAENFAKLAKEYSIESSSRALGGEIPPIKKFGGQPALEQEAFNLKKGELSSILQLGDKQVILLCEGRTEPTKVELAEVRDLIVDDIREKKVHIAMSEAFGRLQEEATIDNYLSNKSQSPRTKPKTLSNIPQLKQVPGR